MARQIRVMVPPRKSSWRQQQAEITATLSRLDRLRRTSWLHRHLHRVSAAVLGACAAGIGTALAAEQGLVPPCVIVAPLTVAAALLGYEGGLEHRDDIDSRRLEAIREAELELERLDKAMDEDER